MRKKIIVAIFMMMLAVGVTACGQDVSSTKATTQETSAKEETKEENEEEKEEVKQEEEKDTKEETELPNWRGIYDYVG